jgi:hypothetical protein
MIMTEHEQRIAIAQAVGWKFKLWHNPSSSDKLWVGPHDELYAHGQYPPDYLHDLNACHEMEKTLKIGDEWATYYSHFVDDGGVKINATASQRALAFLKTKGLWQH